VALLLITCAVDAACDSVRLCQPHRPPHDRL